MAMSEEDKKAMVTAMIAFPFIHIVMSDIRRKRRSKTIGKGDEEPEIEVTGDPQGQ
jgi:hypothetical protein